MSYHHSKQFTPKLFSILKEGYSLAKLKGDVLAGLIVAIVALPLALAIGIASGVSPEKGLITAVVAGFLISFLGGSRVQIGGPTGAFIVVVVGVIQQYGYDGLLIATLLAGIILIIAGYARLGRIINFIPQPVVVGFTAAIAVIIASTQIKNLLGLSIDKAPAEFIPQWATYFSALGSTNVYSLGVGIFTFFVILMLKKWAPRLPGFLIALILASAATYFLKFNIETIGSQFPEISSGLSLPQLPSFSWAKVQEVFPAAFTIAFLAGIEALLSAVVADGMTGFKHRPNQELVAQGVANLISPLFGGLPATGAIARTATNVTAGGKSPVAGILHALFLLLFVLVATPLMKFIPMGALAAILIVVSWGMLELHTVIRLIRLSVQDGVLLLLTFLLTLFIGLTIAIGIGITLASLLFMMRMCEAVQISSGRKEGIEEDEYQRTDLPPGVEVFWILGPIFYGMATQVPDLLKSIGQKPQVLIIRMRLVPYLDTSGASALRDVVTKCQAKNIKVIFSALQEQPSKLLKQVLKKEEALFALNYEKALEEAKKLVL